MFSFHNHFLADGRCLRWMILGLMLALFGCHQEGKDAFPNRTIVLICPWASGGGTDRLARFVASQMEEKLGVPVVVQNKTGGAGAIGHAAGASAKPDGHSILMGTFELSTMHWMGISPLTFEDYRPLIQLNADAAAILVRKDSEWIDLKSFLDHIKVNLGKVQMSGTATGGAWDLARSGMLLAADLPVNSILWIPTHGSAPSLVQLIGGHIDAVCCSVPEAAQVDAGNLRTLAVMSPERLAAYPEIPTLIELGIDWKAVGWRGLLLPKKTPEAIVKSLENVIGEIVDSDAYRDFMKKNGFEISIRSSNEFAEFLKQEDARWGSVIEAAGMSSK